MTPATSPRFLTVTANALWETTYELDSDWSPGATARAARLRTQVGGKGINVARVLARLGAPAEALLFAGGPSGDAVRAWLESHGVVATLFPNPHPTRTGTVVRSPGQRETTVLGPDDTVAPQAWAALAAHLAEVRGLAGPAPVLAVCGKVPGFAPDGPHAPFARAIEAWAEAGAPLALDTYGPFLPWALGLSPLLVKFNRAELGLLTGGEVPRAEVPATLRRLASRHPATTWVVTDGAGPVHLLAPGSSVRSWQPAPIREVSPTGSGDVVLAVLLDQHVRGGAPWPTALAEALAHASAKAACAETVDYAWPQPNELRPIEGPPAAD